MNEKLLQEIGLTEGETKVYFALVKLGLTKSGPLANESGESYFKVYKIIEKLEKKGLVGHVLKGDIKYFQASNPNRILEYIEEKEKSLEDKKKQVEKMIPEISNYLSKSGNLSEAAIYDGYKGTTNLFKTMLDEINKGEEYYVIGASYGDVKGLRDFFYKHHIRRAEKGIKLKMLANLDVKGNIEPTTKKQAEIKYLPQYLMTKMEIVFYKEKSFIILWTESPVAFLIKNAEASKSFKQYFDFLWKIAKP